MRNLLGGLLMLHRAAERVQRIGGQNGHSAIAQYVGYAPDFACVRVAVVELCYHGSTVLLKVQKYKKKQYDVIFFI